MSDREHAESGPTSDEPEPEWCDVYDVRPILAALRTDPEPDLDRVDWDRFSYFGRGPDIPDLVRALAGPDPDEAWRAARILEDRLFYQRGMASPASALVVPFLLRVAADPAVHVRTWALATAAIAEWRMNYVVECRPVFFRVAVPPGEAIFEVDGSRRDWTIQGGAREALRADELILVALIADENPDVRTHAAFALATALDPQPSAVAALRTQLAAESDPAARLSLVLAIALLGADADEAERWWRDTTQPIDVRFAGAIGWLSLTDRPAPADLLDLLDDSTPVMANVVTRVPWDFEHWDQFSCQNDLAAWLTGFLNATAS